MKQKRKKKTKTEKNKGDKNYIERVRAYYSTPCTYIL